MFQNQKRLRIVHCTRGVGIGGIAKMDSLYFRFLDKNLFDPFFVVINDYNPNVTPQDKSIPFFFTGHQNRFESLVNIFSHSDIVTFLGGFEPVVCEATRLSRVPVLVEIMHNVASAQLFPNIDITICVSKTVRDQQMYPEKTFLIHNGIDLNEFKFNRHSFQKNKIVILEAGSRDKPSYFHLDELADDILSLDPRIEIWLAGQNQESNSTDRIKFLGVRNDIHDLYSQSDLLFQLSKMESFGLTAAEAMACGCLPIVSGDGGLAEIVEDGVNGWILPSYERNFVIAKIREIIGLHGTPKWNDMRIAARAHIEKNFPIQNCIKNYENIFLNLIELKGRRENLYNPIDSEPSIDVYLGEAIFHVEYNRMQKATEVIGKIGSHTSNFTNAHSHFIAEYLACHLRDIGRNDLAYILFRKLFRL